MPTADEIVDLIDEVTARLGLQPGAGGAEALEIDQRTRAVLGNTPMAGGPVRSYLPATPYDWLTIPKHGRWQPPVVQPPETAYAKRVKELIARGTAGSYWKLGEVTGVFADSVGKIGGTPSAVGVIRDQQSLVLRGDRSIRFEGGGYIDFGKIYDCPAQTKFTFGCWIRPKELKAGTIATTTDKKPEEGWDLRLDNGEVVFRRLQGGAHDEIKSNAVTADAVAFVVATYDGTNMRLFVNGKKQDGDVASAKALAANPASFRLGSGLAGVGFTGAIDEAFIATDVAAPEADVAKLFAAGSPAFGQFKDVIDLIWAPSGAPAAP